MTTTALNNVAGAATTSGATAGAKQSNAADMSERFLKLLVTQLQNQDPLNPMENAELTSQMAQINTVTGIEKLNTSMQSIGDGFAQMQLLQGANLVGRSVMLDGNNLFVGEEGKAYAGYELSSAASNVRIEVLNAAGVTIDTISAGEKGSGRQSFDWTPPVGVATNGLTFRVTGTSGGSTVQAKPLTFDGVTAINNNGGTLTLELASGQQVPYSQVRAIS